jgi:hypothetical protein
MRSVDVVRGEQHAGDDPIVFCASLAVVQLNAAAETSCSYRNRRSTRDGGIQRKIPCRHDPEAEDQSDERRQEDEEDRLGPAL